MMLTTRICHKTEASWLRIPMILATNIQLLVMHSQDDEERGHKKYSHSENFGLPSHQDTSKLGLSFSHALMNAPSSPIHQGENKYLECQANTTTFEKNCVQGCFVGTFWLALKLGTHSICCPSFSWLAIDQQSLKACCSKANIIWDRMSTARTTQNGCKWHHFWCGWDMQLCCSWINTLPFHPPRREHDPIAAQCCCCCCKVHTSFFSPVTRTNFKLVDLIWASSLISITAAWAWKLSMNIHRRNIFTVVILFSCT